MQYFGSNIVEGVAESWLEAEMSWVEVDGAGWRLKWVGWRWMELGGAGWRWMVLGGGGWCWVEVDEAGWRWVHGLVIPKLNFVFENPVRSLICLEFAISANEPLTIWLNCALDKKWSFPLRISSVNVTNFLRIWSHLLTKSLMENFNFSEVMRCGQAYSEPNETSKMNIFAKIVLTGFSR